jgi:hypothetical protein
MGGGFQWNTFRNDLYLSYLNPLVTAKEILGSFATSLLSFLVSSLLLAQKSRVDLM